MQNELKMAISQNDQNKQKKPKWAKIEPQMSF